MKITAIKPVFAQGENRVFVFVKVETDQPGLIGWGEASLEGKPRKASPGPWRAVCSICSR